MAVKKVTVNLPDETVEAVNRIANDRQISFTEALRRLIEVQKFLDEEVKKGGKILLQTSDNSMSRVVFK
jgi:predicted transcriptional regulator